jgi:hypothetical protein
VALNDLTSCEEVERAMDEFDEIGRRPFLAKYHFGDSRLYLVMRNGNRMTRRPSPVRLSVFSTRILGH